MISFRVAVARLKVHVSVAHVSNTLLLSNQYPEPIDMELRHLRYFVAVGEDEHYGRAAKRLRVAQPALSSQIQDLEREIGFQLFDRLPRGVRLSAAGKVFLEDCRRILQELNDAAVRAERAARGLIGTLRVGFTESASWHGVVPDSLREFRRRHPEVELQLSPLISLDQVEALRSGRFDAGFVYHVPRPDPDIDHVQVGSHKVVLATPQRHPVSRFKHLRLRDLAETDFVWFPRRQHPANYDRLLQACSRGGLTHPRIVQEAADEATMLSLVSCGLGVAFVTDATRWRCPKDVQLRRVIDLRLPITLSLVWRKANRSPLLARFVAEVLQLVETRAVSRTANRGADSIS
ncbi:MAG TPA: LysR family transcriptional regulator [Vicinamibacteria bacterium]|jgi:DNA-binding transcriptional LysR family regulator|nr:LysR family transcriptional regulator [Vicinamibacteria bacterium]